MGVEERIRVEELRKELHRWQHQYYVLGTPEVEDLVYDTRFNELLNLEAQFPELRSGDSPTMRVGSDLVSELPEVEHTLPVLSLDKRYTSEAVVGWVEKIQPAKSSQTNQQPQSETESNQPIGIIAEEKLDGISIVLYYEEGILQRAVTRGNGYRGNDVTENVKTIGSVPLTLPKPITLAVRGEIYIPIAQFEAMKSLEEYSHYANPRNLAAGTIRRKQSSSVAKVPLQIFVYEGFSPELPGDHEEILLELQALGFRVNRWKRFSTPAEFLQIPQYLEQLTKERSSLEYEVDGVVFKVADLGLREKLGYTGHHPRWAVAWKFESPEAETRVEGIDVQVGRSGRVTPVARVVPVEVGGARVSNITLHNSDYIDTLELAIGDVVTISRRGDVIPAVERVIDSSGNPVWHMPKECPICNTPLEDRGAHTFCPNYHCPEQVYGRILFFVGRNQMDIDGLGGQTLRTLIDYGFIQDIADLYSVDWAKVSELPGFGTKKVTHIQDSLERSKERSFAQVLTSLGIPEIGSKMVELLIEGGYRSIDSLLALEIPEGVERLTSIPGVGELSATKLIKELHTSETLATIEALRGVGLSFALSKDELAPATGESQLFANQSWCITGSFQHYNPRSLAGVEIKKRGGKVVTGVSGKTTHLLAGEGAGQKLTKAQSLGVRVVLEDEFLQLIRE